ncbi:uncharacterized protein VTP21DRAFT_11075 [Calcarisporiella thermophila]|uniref:uncharacterized protein n=1 Tax=Calcarisporiella thermophila TaxID=911321 RepID=UPI003742803D
MESWANPFFGSPATTLATEGSPSFHENTVSMQFHPIDDIMRCYSPDNLPGQSRTRKSLSVNGVSLLNRKNVDSHVALERIKKRREAHSRLERKRRDLINQLLCELVKVIPSTAGQGDKCHRAVVLQEACFYIKELQCRVNELSKENEGLKIENFSLKSCSPSQSSD